MVQTLAPGCRSEQARGSPVLVEATRPSRAGRRRLCAPRLDPGVWRLRGSEPAYRAYRRERGGPGDRANPAESPRDSRSPKDRAGRERVGGRSDGVISGPPRDYTVDSVSSRSLPIEASTAEILQRDVQKRGHA